MQHVFQVAIHMDDENIIKNVSKSAEEAIIKDLKKEVGDQIFHRSYYGSRIDGMTDWAAEQFRKFLDDNKEEIISRAAADLGTRLARSKAGKEILENLKEEM